VVGSIDGALGASFRIGIARLYSLSARRPYITLCGKDRPFMPTLNWIGKEAVVDHHHRVPTRLLECDPALSVGDPNAENLLIEGDNLEALKALLPRYRGRVKCIYIDPPYNTGNEEWRYNDNVNDPRIRKWLDDVVGKEAEDLCRHDKWLCMMYPRLSLLRELLTEDGVVFISIGKDEFANLRLLCDEVFGYRNLIEVFIWNTEGHTENQERVTTVHEYVLAYEKRRNAAHFRAIVDPNIPEDSKIRRNFAENSITKNGPGNPPSIVTLPRGFPCAAESLDVPAFSGLDELVSDVTATGYITREITRKNDAVYPVRLDRLVVRDFKLTSPCRVYSGWSSLKKLTKFIDNDCQAIDDEGTQLSYFLSDRAVIYYRRDNRISSHIQTVLRNLGTTEKNRNELETMGVTFNYPKPKELIAYLISLCTEESDIVLDSFAGSGTTLHAVWLQNAADSMRRKFIGVEILRETAATVTAARLKFLASTAFSDCGFRYCRLGRSLLDENGNVNGDVPFVDLARYVYLLETGVPIPKRPRKDCPLLGVHRGQAIYLLYNGVLGDRRPAGGNVLTRSVLDELPGHPDSQGPRVVFGEACRLGDATLAREQVTFRQIPYSLREV
jgi:adenine-specific DNA-methyltransferase